MGTTGKQQATPPRAATPPQQQRRAPVNATPLRDDTFAASHAYLEHRGARTSKPPSPTLTTFRSSSAGLAAAGITASPFLAVMVVCLELLWMVFAPGSKLLQKTLWDPQFDREEREQEQAALAARVAGARRARPRARRELIARQQEINQLAAQNPSFTGELLRTSWARPTASSKPSSTWP